MKKGKIGFGIFALMCSLFWCQLTTTGGQKYLYNTLPEQTAFIFEQFENVPITENDFGIFSLLSQLFKGDNTTLAFGGIISTQFKDIKNYIEWAEKSIKKIVGLQCKQAGAIFNDATSDSGLRITFNLFGGGMGGFGMPALSINIPIGYTGVYTCVEDEKWQELKKMNSEYSDMIKHLLSGLFKQFKISVKVNYKKYSDKYSKFSLTFSDPTNIAKFKLILHTYIINNAIISSTSKTNIKNYLTQKQGTLTQNNAFISSTKLLVPDNLKSFWWFNYNLLYTSVKKLVFQFIPPMAATGFFQVESALGLDKIYSFTGFKDKNNVWKERINFTRESDFINKVFGQSAPDKDFLCSKVNPNNTMLFGNLNLTKNGVLALIDKIQTLVDFGSSFSGQKDEEFIKFVTGFTKYLQNDTFSGNLCLFIYDKQVNNKNVYRAAFFYKTIDFSQQICEELAPPNTNDCKVDKIYKVEALKQEQELAVWGENEINERTIFSKTKNLLMALFPPPNTNYCKVDKIYKVEDLKQEQELAVWSENEINERIIFSKTKNLLIALLPIKENFAKGNSDTLYKEAIEQTISSEDPTAVTEKNSYDGPLGLLVNLKKTFELVKKEIEQSTESIIPFNILTLFDFYKKYLGDSIYMKFSAGKDYLEIENNFGGALIAAAYGGGVGAAILIPNLLRHR